MAAGEHRRTQADAAVEWRHVEEDCQLQEDTRALTENVPGGGWGTGLVCVQLRDDTEVHFLVNLGARAAHTLRFLSFLGIPASRLVPMKADTLFCAKTMLYSDTEVRRQRQHLVVRRVGSV